MFFLAKALTLFLFSAFVLAQSCTPSGDTGCLNGVGYNTTTEFVCRNAVYEIKTSGCCAAGIPFDLATQFCCYDGVHNFTQYSYCEVYYYNGPPVEEEKTYPINTLQHKFSEYDQPCTSASSDYGCLNGVPYDWSTQYPCDIFILDFSTEGCCVNNFYSYTTQSCCYVNGQYEVLEGGHACEAIPV